ncbi:MAG: helix-turn-helix domain-containing protein [Bdellovibrionota bacterium]
MRNRNSVASPAFYLVPASSHDIGEGSLKIEWLDTTESAEFLRVSIKSLRNMTSNGQIPFYKLGRRNRYRKDELEALLLSQKRGKQYGN